jgi:hypothetical protein
MGERMVTLGLFGTMGVQHLTSGLPVIRPQAATIPPWLHNLNRAGV